MVQFLWAQNSCPKYQMHHSQWSKHSPLAPIWGRCTPWFAQGKSAYIFHHLSLHSQKWPNVRNTLNYILPISCPDYIISSASEISNTAWLYCLNFISPPVPTNLLFSILVNGNTVPQYAQVSHGWSTRGLGLQNKRLFYCGRIVFLRGKSLCSSGPQERGEESPWEVTIHQIIRRKPPKYL